MWPGWHGQRDENDFAHPRSTSRVDLPLHGGPLPVKGVAWHQNIYIFFWLGGSLKHRDIIMPHRALLKLEAYQVWARHSLTWAWWHAHRGIRALEVETQITKKNFLQCISQLFEPISWIGDLVPFMEHSCFFIVFIILYMKYYTLRMLVFVWM